MVNERWLTVRQIAEQLQVHEETVRRWLRDGKLRGRLLSDRGGWRVAESEVNRFLSSDEPRADTQS